jgi:hypothetical protein
MGGIMKTLFEKFKSRPAWPYQPRFIKFDTEGFSVTEEGTPEVRGDWISIREVFAYKLDLFSFDEICIGLRYDNSAGMHWWIGESYVGYKDFLEEITRRFPGIRTDWFAEVAKPAFAENRTTLWGEAWSPPQEAPIQSPQHNAGSRPSSGDSPASEIPSAPAPRG